MTRTIRIHDTADLIPLIPHLVGMDPADSVVLVAFTGSRSLGALRITRPTTTPDTALPVAQHLIGLLCNLDTAETLLPVIYTPHRTRDALPDRLLLTVLALAGQDAGFTVPDAVLVAADGWTGLDDSAAPQPVRATTHTLPKLLDTAREGHLPDPDPAAAADLDRHRPAAHSAAAAAFRGFDPTDAIETACTTGAAHPLLAIAAAIPPLRDTVLLQAGWGPDLGRTAWQHNVLGDPISDDSPDALAYRGDWTRPDAARMHTLITGLHATAAAAAPERAALAATLAWCNWALGRSSIAARLAATAISLDPALSLADLVSRWVAAGTLPAWAWRTDPAQRYDPLA